MENEVLLTQKVVKGKALKNIKAKKATSFLEGDDKFNFEIDKKQKMKLCSKDKYSNAINILLEKYSDKENPIIIGHIGGFFEVASLTGNMVNYCKKGTKPYTLFFDKNPNNIQNAIFNTLLIKLSSNEKEFLMNLFNFSKIEILKCFDEDAYLKYILESEKTKMEDINKEIEEKYLDSAGIDKILRKKFNYKKLGKYIEEKKQYNASEHYKNLVELAKKHLPKEMLNIFMKVTKNVCNYLDTANNYKQFFHYLSDDIARNKTIHILNNRDAFNGYKSLISYNGVGNIKFLPNVDISTNEGLNTLESILKESNIIGSEKENEFPIDIAVIPHLYKLQNTYPFIKQNVENYMVANRNKNLGFFETFRTTGLDVRTSKTIGAEKIMKDREERIPLKHLTKTEPEKGFPLLMFMAGSHFGNIYHSERDTLNMIDMALENKVDTVFIRGLFYSTFYHNQTSRSELTDPTYPTLDSRLKKARSVIKQLNDAGIKVVYQMSDEEESLYDDMFRIYTREQGVKGNNFLAREDLRSRYRWVKPIIKQDLIPYMIRKGEDAILFNTDEATETRVSLMCEAIKAYRDGTPLGNLAKFLEPKYLQNNDMFKVISGGVINFDENDKAISVSLRAKTMFSKNTQYKDGTKGVKRHITSMQTGAFRTEIKENSQIVADLRQGAMEVGIMDDQVFINVPQMIKDEWAINNDELLPGVKEGIQEDPSSKRTTQSQSKMNNPGGLIITGDSREIMKTIPYFQRSREVMEHVQKTGEGLPNVNVLYLNDTQFGSHTERIAFMLKAVDYAFYTYNIKGILGIGDFQQGWNYPDFPHESRHLGTSSVSQQMVDLNKLFRPWFENSFGVINSHEFEIEDEKRNIKVDEETNNNIIKSLKENNLIRVQKGMFGDVHSILEEIDYKTIDLKLPLELKMYEPIVREKLSSIHLLWFFHLIEGNHERNTDWNNKGYKLIEHLYLELENLKRFSGSNIELVCPEFFANYKGDIVKGAYGSKKINGYNIAYSHDFRSKGKGSGDNPILSISNYFDQMGTMSRPFDRAVMGHLHISHSGVYNNKYLSIAGSTAGQSGYEQKLGYKSQPTVVIDCYRNDGSIMTITIGEEFLKTYKIQNPYVASIGLDRFIHEQLQQPVYIYGPDAPEEIHEPVIRTLKVVPPNKIIGPNI